MVRAGGWGWISILVTTIRETTSGTPRRRVVEAAAAPAIPIPMTTGANPRRARATVMMMHGQSDAVLATIAKSQNKTRETATPILAGLTAIATIENAIARSRMHSPAMFTYHVDQSANWFMTVVATTLCAAPNRGADSEGVEKGADEGEHAPARRQPRSSTPS